MTIIIPGLYENSGRKELRPISVRPLAIIIICVAFVGERLNTRTLQVPSHGRDDNIEQQTTPVE